VEARCSAALGVAHRELDLAAVNADVPQRTIVEPLELTNGAAPASFRG